MTMTRMPDIGYPPSVGKFRDEQIAQQKTWTVIPEGQRTIADLHVVHVVPSNGSTLTHVNPVDPGDGYYLERPYTPGRIVPAGKAMYG